MSNMLKKSAIEKTTVCYWSKEDKCFVVESPLFPRTAGVGDTEQAARQQFRELLLSAYEHIKNNNVAGYNKVGRPAKGAVELHVGVRPGTKKDISTLADEFEASQGEIIDFLLFFYQIRKNDVPIKLTQKTKQHNIGLQRRFTAILETLKKTESELTVLKNEVHN